MARAFSVGSNQYLRVATPAITVHPFTLATWFYITNSTAHRILLSLVDYDATNYAWLQARSTNVLRIEEEGDYYAAATTVATFNDNTWHHACGVCSTATNRTIYLDGGNNINNTNSATPATLSDTMVGAGAAASAILQPMDGYLAEAAIWNVALTADEVAILATGISPLAVRPGSIIFYVPLVRDNDEDIIGGLSLTAYNSPTIAVHPPIYYPFTPFYYMVSGAPPPEDLSIDIGLDEAAYQGTGVRII